MTTCFCTHVLPLILLGGRKTLHQVHWMAPRGECSVMFDCTFRSKIVSKSPVLRFGGTVRGDRLYLDQWLALSTASWATLLLRHVIRCHSRWGAGKRVKGRHRQMALALFLRLSQVEESLRRLKRARSWSPRNLPCGGLGLSKSILSIAQKCENI